VSGTSLTCLSRLHQSTGVRVAASQSTGVPQAAGQRRTLSGVELLLLRRPGIGRVQVWWRSGGRPPSPTSSSCCSLRVSLGIPFFQGILIFPRKISSYSLEKIGIPSSQTNPKRGIHGDFSPLGPIYPNGDRERGKTFPTTGDGERGKTGVAGTGTGALPRRGMNLLPSLAYLSSTIVTFFCTDDNVWFK
jgi:hypothetical protein